MVLNILLVFLVFGAAKKNFSPYAAALIFGVIKGAICFVAFRNIAAAVIVLLIYAGIASGFVFFLRRIEKKDDRDRPEIPTYRAAGSDRIKFRWEYIPLVLLLLLLIGGDYIST